MTPRPNPVALPPAARLALALAELGDSPNAVAATLAAADCRGTPECPARCPVAVWLARHGWRVEVLNDRVMAGPFVSVPLPWAVAEFVLRYDAMPHWFPALLVRA